MKRADLMSSFADRRMQIVAPRLLGWSIEYRPDYPDEIVAKHGLTSAVLDAGGFSTHCRIRDERAAVPAAVVECMLERWRAMAGDDHE